MKSRATYFSIFMGLLVVSSFSACTTVPSTKSDHEIRVVTFTQRYMRGDDCLTVVGQGENIMCRATRNKMIDSIALSNLPKGHMELCFQTESRVNALCIEGELDKEYRERFLIGLRPLETSLLSPYRVTRSNRDLFDKIEFIQYSAPQGFAGK